VTSWTPRRPRAAKPAQEGEPEGSILTGAHVQPQHLALALPVDGGGDDHSHVHYPAILAHLLGEGVQPDIGVMAIGQRPLAEGLDECVQFAADAGDLAARDAVAAQGLDEILHPAGGNALDVGLLDDGEERPFAAAARFQEGWEVAAGA